MCLLRTQIAIRTPGGKIVDIPLSVLTSSFVLENIPLRQFRIGLHFDSIRIIPKSASEPMRINSKKGIISFLENRLKINPTQFETFIRMNPNSNWSKPNFQFKWIRVRIDSKNIFRIELYWHRYIFRNDSW